MLRCFFFPNACYSMFHLWRLIKIFVFPAVAHFFVGHRKKKKEKKTKRSPGGLYPDRSRLVSLQESDSFRTLSRRVI